MDSDGAATLEDWAFRGALIAAPAVAVLAYLSADDPEAAFRYAGGTLELAGFFLVIFDLELRLERFGDRTGALIRFARNISAAVHRVYWEVAGWFGKEEAPEEKRVSKSVTAYAEHRSRGLPDRPQSFSSVTERFRMLESELDTLTELVLNIRDLTKQKRALLREDLEEEIQELRGEIGDVRSTFRQSVGHGYRLEALGVFFFLIGVALGTWGPAVF